jgi:SAM-dependent methyltransferase
MRLVDFGCGTGRFVRFFGERGCAVLGTEITPSMIAEAEAEGIPAGCRLCLTDGTSIPTPDASVDMIWCCAVLRYSLLVADPVYDRIAVEMFRALRPGGWVVNVQIYVEQPPGTFLMDFERAGFVTREVRILQRHGGRLERLLSHRLWPLACIPWTARLCARLRYRLDRPDRSVPGLRDYVFVWQKPPCEG